jgi:hypothetical protein
MESDEVTSQERLAIDDAAQRVIDEAGRLCWSLRERPLGDAVIDELRRAVFEYNKARAVPARRHFLALLDGWDDAVG